MAYKVEIMCYKCNEEFEVKDDQALPIDSEGGYHKQAICDKCGADNGVVQVTLVIP